MASTHRLARIDHVRGLAALCILIFHLVQWTWTFSEMHAGMPLERGGIFAVSIFYMLSGVSLYHAYGPSLNASGGWRVFFVRRFFRIFPLLWVTALISYFVWRQLYDPGMLALTLSGMFGFVAWDQHVGTGLWSIGNELVFYALFPLLLFVLGRRQGRWAIAGLAALGLVIAAFFTLDPSIPLADQWKAYSAPWHQLPYFLIGMLLLPLFRIKPVASVTLPRLAMLACLVFIAFWPVHGDKVMLVTGPQRILFTLACAGLVAFALMDRRALPAPFERTLTMLGEASYALYMLHPIVVEFNMAVCGFLSVHVIEISMKVRLVSAALASICVAYLVHRWFEQYFIGLGKRLVQRKTLPVADGS